MNRIIKALKENPNLSLSQVARLLRLETYDVAEAQREYLRPKIKRDSPMWDMKNCASTHIQKKEKRLGKS